VGEVLIVVGVALLALLIVGLPFLIGRRRHPLSGKLSQYQLVTEALVDGNLADAREALTALIRTDTEDVAAYVRLARVLRREGNLERAVTVYRSLRAREIRDRVLRQQVLAGLTEDLYRLGRFDEARVVGEELRQIDRRHPLIYLVEVHDAIERADWAAAQKAADGLRRSGRGYAGPRSGQIRTHIAGRRAEEGELREARRILEDALRDEPDYGPALLLLGDLRAREGDPQKAVEVWERLLKAHPAATRQVLERIEKAYFELGRFSDLSSLYEGLAASTKEPALHLARARMALRRGDPDEAARIVEDLLEEHPTDRAARDWRILLLLDAGRIDEAREVLKQGLEASILQPQGASCRECGTPAPAVTVRCAQCGAWLPDPLAGSAPERPA